MPVINTLRGPVDTSELGLTLMHEHVFVLTSDVQQNYPGEWGSEDERVADAVRRLRSAYDAGVRTIVDPTVVGLGRYVPRVQRIVEQLNGELVAEGQPPLTMVVATGLYTYDDVPFYFHYRGPALDAVVGSPVPDPMVQMFVGDIGIAGTDVRAGMLKCAIDAQGMTEGVERVMRAVAMAHTETGVPITVHTHPEARTGLEVRRVMCDGEGVDPSRIVLGHSGDTIDVDHLCELADLGFVLGMDRFGINLETTFEARADTLVELVRRGYAERMVLSQDANCYIDWLDPDVRAFLPQWHYTHIFEDVIPYVSERGVTQEHLDTMLVDVPRRFFEGA